MAGKIFINYRRDDSIGTAGRLHDRLVQAFGRKNLFMDVDHIPAGVDFVDHLNTQVAACDVFLAVIGPHWLDAVDDSGRRRLENPDDFVAVEIAAALTRGIRVIPVMIDGAAMPKASDLPAPLMPLVRRNAVEVRNAQFGRDAEALVEKIRLAFKGGRAVPRRWLAAASVVVLLLAGWVGLSQMGVPVWLPWRPAAVQPGPGGAEKADAKAAADATRQAAEAEQQRVAGLKAAGPVAETSSAAPLSPERERALAPKDSFKECDACPEMVVVPAGSFAMGSPANEEGNASDELPQHAVTFARQFAVGRFALTFDEWDACAADGGCNGYRPADQGWGRGRRPVINVSWKDARSYLAWLSRKTGRTYRLMSEAEREYVMRAGTTTPFWWGSSIATSQANYNGTLTYAAGAQGENRQQTLPVDKFQPNPWGLFQVHGNAWDALEDCYHASYAGAPADGSAWTLEDCAAHVVRGGSWLNPPAFLRAAHRGRFLPDVRAPNLGFRVARTLNP
jgi:formylglycine-generating enzyme required for sulfatase activity